MTQKTPSNTPDNTPDNTVDNIADNTPDNIADNVADNVAVLATCLADALRPQAVRATCSLVAGITSKNTPPALPRQQTCCGQVLYNAGDRKGAMRQAVRVLDLFEPFAAVVVPSGSCAGMLKCHYPQLLADTKHAQRAVAFAQKSWELTEFLHLHRPCNDSPKVSVKKPATPAATPTTTLTFHDSCSCLREGNNSVACTRSLLVERGFRVHEASNREVCCGFGGKFSISNSAISTRMADDKLACLQQSGAKIVSSCDLGCLLHLAGRARRRALPLSFFHIAELLEQHSLQKPRPIGD